jgi:hypothetical protein
MKSLREKTGKREYAFVLMSALLWLVWTGDTAMMQIVVWPFLSFVATAAGLHIYDKTYGKGD